MEALDEDIATWFSGAAGGLAARQPAGATGRPATRRTGRAGRLCPPWSGRAATLKAQGSHCQGRRQGRHSASGLCAALATPTRRGRPQRSCTRSRIGTRPAARVQSGSLPNRPAPNRPTGWRAILGVLLTPATCLWVQGCGGDSKSPTSPSVAQPVVRAISVSPSGVGLENATEFTFSADTNATAPQSTFAWQFGDGSSTTAGGTVTHVFTRAGTFTVQLVVTNAAGQASASTTVRVASLIGTWIGTVTGHTRFPPNRPIPIRAFELRLYQSLGPPGPASATTLNASWTDDAGCRENRYGFIHGEVKHPRSVKVGVESLLCNDGDFYLDGTADEEIRTVTGRCPLGGPACEFRMVRQ